MILWLLTLARADPLDALDPAARPFFARAEAEEEAGRFGTAASFYRLVIDHDPRFVPAWLGLGRAQEGQADPAAAESTYRTGPSDPDLIAALATLLESSRPVEALRLWRQVAVVRLGDPTPHLHAARLLVASDPLAAAVEWRSYEDYLQGAEPDADTLLALADALTPLDAAAAEAQLRAYLGSFPDGAAAPGVRERLDRLEIEAAAALIELGGDEPLPPSLTPALVSVDEALAARQVDRAVDGARALVAAAPQSAVAHGRYADALLASEAWSEAEVQARIARRLAPDDAQHRARLGHLLASAYGGRRDDEAAEELGAACRLLPGDVSLRYRFALVQQSVGDWSGAAASFRAVLEADPQGDFATDAQARLASLTRAAPVLPEVAVSGAPTSPEAARQYRIGLALLERGRREEALLAFDAALAAEPRNVRILNQRAGLLREGGDVAGAMAAWQASLAIDPEQAVLWRNLAAEAQTPDERRSHLGEAARLGDPDARYLLALMAAQAGDWTTARAELGAYEAVAPATSAYREAARQLAEQASSRQRRIYAAVVAVGGFLGSAPLLLWWHRRNARSLAECLAAAPAAWHEAARLLSGIRHEVLKHNTTVLPEVAEALARGDPGPWEALRARIPELSERARAYVDGLVSLFRTHQLQLDPRRDAVLGPLLAGFRRLTRLRRPTSEELLELSHVVNVEVYDALGRIVREICVLRVDPTMVHAVYARVCQEPGFARVETEGEAGPPVPALVVAGDSLAVRLFREDLDDILANLLRNALAAGARTLAVELSEGEDEVTGHPLAEIAVVDDAPGTLTNAMIRSRFIGRGLGLAVDLVNRHNGAIRVEPRGDGQKSVVVQFRAVESADVDAPVVG